MAGNVTEVSDNNFDTEVLESSTPTLVDFWAPWCGPCRAIAPMMETIANEQAGKVKVVKLNVDDNPRTAAKFNVRSIPTIILFKNGEAVNQVIGAVPKQNIESMISGNLS